jgi:uncharacterized phage-like protein YoqJ
MRGFKIMMTCTIEFAEAMAASASKERRYTLHEYDSPTPFTQGTDFVLTNSTATVLVVE